MLHDVNADRRTQIGLVMIPADFGNHIMHRSFLFLRDVGERIPHHGFKPHAGSMIANRDSPG